LVASDLKSRTKQEEALLLQNLEMLYADDIANYLSYLLSLDRRIHICETKIKPLKQNI